MGKNSNESLGVTGRKDALPFDPDALTLVTDTTHPLFDERVHLMPDKAFVANIKHFGVIEPIIVRKNGVRDGVPIVEVIAGRQRVKAARIANQELKREGKPPIRVYGIIRRGDDAELAEVAVSENEARNDDDALTRAKKMQRLLDLGRTEAQLTVSFCCSLQTVKAHLKLLDLAPQVQAAVSKGTIAATLAVQELAKLPREEQVPKLQALLESGAKGAEAKGALRRLKAGEAATSSDGPTLPNKRELRRLMTDLAATLEQDGAVSAHDAAELRGAERVLRLALEGKRPKGLLGKAWTAARKPAREAVAAE